MENSDLEQTLPTDVQPPVGNQDDQGETLSTQDAPDSLPSVDAAQSEGTAVQVNPPARRGRWSCLLITGIGLLFLVLVAALSAFGGYSSGISLRQSAESTQVAYIVQEQYQLGIQDIDQGNYERARQRFEYVIELNPVYPGAADKLAEVLLQLHTTATPTLRPTPTLSPTPDLRGVQQLYDQSQQHMLNSEWTQAIDALLELRKSDSTFHAVEVDGMLFLALRNRAIDKILKDADLEGGIYDLTLASRFGPLDAEAQSYLNWTGLYITGVSFWGIDWEQVVNYLIEVAPQLPNLRDKSGYTATQRLSLALVEYGNVLAENGQWCKAGEQYQAALSIGPDPQVEQALNTAINNCSKGGDQTTPGGKKKRTPTPNVP